MAKKWIPLSEEHKNKIRLGHIGLKPSIESRIKMSMSHIGHKPSLETIKKLSEIRKGKPSWNKGKKYNLSAKILSKNCLQCGTSFTNKKLLYGKVWESKKYCCRKCSWLSQVGISKPPHTEEWKKQNSIRNKGKINSPETRAKQAISKMWAKNPFWKGWITEEHKCIRGSAAYRDWRTSVFERDSYKCTCCNKKWWWSKAEKRQINIQADHIKPFAMHPDLRFDINNGRTLCEDCHRKTPTWWAKKEYWLKHPILA